MTTTMTPITLVIKMMVTFAMMAMVITTAMMKMKATADDALKLLQMLFSFDSTLASILNDL